MSIAVGHEMYETFVQVFSAHVDQRHQITDLPPLYEFVANNYERRLLYGLQAAFVDNLVDHPYVTACRARALAAIEAVRLCGGETYALTTIYGPFLDYVRFGSHNNIAASFRRAGVRPKLGSAATQKALTMPRAAAPEGMAARILPDDILRLVARLLGPEWFKLAQVCSRWRRVILPRAGLDDLTRGLLAALVAKKD